MFVANMKKPNKPQKQHAPSIAFLTHDWQWGTVPLQPNGCAWYRCKLPSDQLNKRGWSTAVGFPCFRPSDGFGMLIEDSKAVYGWDIIVFKLLMQKEIHDAMKIALSNGQKIVVDIDDFFDGLPESNKAWESTHPDLSPTLNRKIYSEIILDASAVITSTPFLFNYYSSKRDNVFMVRNGIDIDIPSRGHRDRWPRKSLSFLQNKYKNARPKTIGWVGATHWRANDLEQLSNFFGSYIDLRKLKFHHSGHADTAPIAHELLGIDKKFQSQSGMAPILEYPKLFRKMDIGIVPLNNVPFNHAKSFIKGLEYAASGTPFISSFSPEYRFLAESGIGCVAHNESEWVYILDKLLEPENYINEINKNYLALDKFSMNARGDDWDATMKVILEKI